MNQPYPRTPRHRHRPHLRSRHQRWNGDRKGSGPGWSGRHSRNRHFGNASTDHRDVCPDRTRSGLHLRVRSIPNRTVVQNRTRVTDRSWLRCRAPTAKGVIRPRPPVSGRACGRCSPVPRPRRTSTASCRPRPWASLAACASNAGTYPSASRSELEHTPCPNLGGRAKG